MSRHVVRLAALGFSIAMFLQVLPAMAETREVAPGVRVTWKTFPAPVNEAPFYGFVDKSLTLRRADDVFVSIAVDMSSLRQPNHYRSLPVQPARRLYSHPSISYCQGWIITSSRNPHARTIR